MARKTRFERAIIRRRNKIEKRGQRMAFKAIKEQYKTIFDLVGILTPQALLDNVNQFVQETSIRKFMNDYYPMFSEIGVMVRNEAKRNKQIEDEYWDNNFMQKLRNFALTETGARITSITETTEKFIRGAVESAMQQGVEEGLGVDKISRLIRKNLTDSLGDIGRSRAKMIAQTEMTTGSNQASQFGIDSTGLEYRKFWSTSGLPNIRDSHIFAQDNYPNGIAKDELFDMGNGNFMRFVGDPMGAPEEVINCRCTTLHEVI
jgi:hypothetical protein